MSTPTRAPERDMIQPLLTWIQRARVAGTQPLFAEEVSLHGKRIDLVVASKTRILNCFELKTNHSASVIRQAMLNSLSCDKSYVVTRATPNTDNLGHARALGLGWLVVTDADVVKQILKPERQNPIPEAHRRLTSKVVSGGKVIEHV